MVFLPDDRFPLEIGKGMTPRHSAERRIRHVALSIVSDACVRRAAGSRPANQKLDFAFRRDPATGPRLHAF
jgi:hypothetical protein